jgi:hypothetical protein
MAPPRAPSYDGLWLLVALGALVFVSPLRFVWSGEGAPWYSAFVVWAVFIGATALVVRRRGRDDGGS